MNTDTIVAEVRQARDTFAQRCNYDLRAMIADARERQEAGGRRVLSFAAKPPKKASPVPSPSQGTQPSGAAVPG
jgi:hypothetical protein